MLDSLSLELRCPSETILADHARNALSAQDTAVVDRHIEECTICFNRFVELSRTSPAHSIGDCHIVKEIGRGRFGVVYKAWWMHERPRIVALKILHSPGEMERNRFDREIAVLKKLDSPWIVKCLDSGAAGDAAHYVMEFIEGVHLDDFFHDRPHTLSEKLAVFERICRAVADAHAHGVVHRDLKPRNILVDTQDQPHILDFGICSVNAPNWSSLPSDTITHPGDIIGTLRYMSPEQAWGGAAGDIDHRSDIWALGIMLYEIVTDGGYPYSVGSTPVKPAHEALIDRIRRELPQLPKLDHLPRGHDLRTLLERCLAWDGDARLESAAVLADDLRHIREGRPITTRTLPLSYRARRVAIGLAARSRWTFAAVFVSVVAGFLWATCHWGRVGWNVRGSEYQALAPRQESGLTAPDVRETILIAGVFDDSAATVDTYAKQHDLADVSSSPLTWRGVHAHLMHRLVDAAPRAVLWDYYFAKPRDADAELAAAANALEHAGVPVVFATSEYDPNGRPQLSPTLVADMGRSLRHGSIDARDMVQRPGEVVLATRSANGAAIPNVVLVLLAGLLHPECKAEFEWTDREPALSVLYEVQPGAYLRARDRIEFSRVFLKGLPGETIPTGPPQGCATFGLVPPAEWERRTIPYERLLTCELSELRELVSGRVLLVGDLRPSRLGFAADRHRVAIGSKIVDDVPGVYLLANAVAGLLDRRYVKPAFPLAPVTFACLLALSIAGCLLPVPLARSPRLDLPAARRRMRVGFFALTMVALGAMLFTQHVVSVHTGMAGVAFFAPMLGAFWVEFARNRHRVHDRKRHSLETFSMSTGGTVTLPMRTEKLFPEIR